MKSGFSFELYNDIFENCYIHSSKYQNGNLQLSLYGEDSKTNEVAHFADITLNQNSKKLKENEIVVDCLYKPTLIPQLKKLGVIDKQVGICIIGFNIYPIYTVNFKKIIEKQYQLEELIAA